MHDEGMETRWWEEEEIAALLNDYDFLNKVILKLIAIILDMKEQHRLGRNYIHLEFFLSQKSSDLTNSAQLKHDIPSVYKY